MICPECRRQPQPSMQSSLCIQHCCCLYRGKLKWSEAYPHKLVAAWSRKSSIFFIRYVSWVQTKIMTKPSCCLWRGDRNLGCRLLYSCLPRVLSWLLSNYIDPLLEADKSECWVMAASYCQSWWKWWSNFNVRLMDALILVLSIVVLLKMTQWFLSKLYYGVFSLIILIYFMYFAMWDDICPTFPSVDVGISFTD